MSQALWQPDARRMDAALLTRFRGQLARRHPELAAADYPALQAWSVSQDEAFWNALWEFCEVIGERSGPIRDGRTMPGARYFPGARLNFAENLLERGADADPALRWRDETGQARRLSRGDLRAEVARVAAGLRRLGLAPGDRVAAMLPNRPETVIAMLATTSLGGVWSSCSPDFGEAGVLDRFGQIEPRVLLACADYPYGGKRFDVRDKAAAVRRQLPDLDAAFMLGGQAEGFAGWDALRGEVEPITYRRLPFNDPLYILYSSGTTGAPKCIVHGIGGTLLQHLKEHQLQADIHPGEAVFYYTTCGWMMWNWLVSALASRAEILLFDGSPFAPAPLALFEYIAEAKASFFGVSAKFIDALKARGLEPGSAHDLGHLRSIASTGSPLVAESFEYAYRAIKPDMALQSISGGTDIVACFVAGNPWQPVYAGQIQGPALGMAVDVVDEQGRSLPPGQKGDLVCRAPFPSMPIGFWNDTDGSRYRQAYFERLPGLWHHGDYAERTAEGGFVIHGRSDATLNPGGVRIGTAEIYRQVEQIPEVLESLAVGQPWDDDVRIVLFVILQDGLLLDDALRERIRQRIRQGASPRHVPARILQVTDFPRTRSGKLAELAVRAIIQGEEVKNRNALANPEALDLFRNRAELSR